MHRDDLFFDPLQSGVTGTTEASEQPAPPAGSPAPSVRERELARVQSDLEALARSRST